MKTFTFASRFALIAALITFGSVHCGSSDDQPATSDNGDQGGSTGTGGSKGKGGSSGSGGSAAKGGSGGASTDSGGGPSDTDSETAADGPETADAPDNDSSDPVDTGPGAGTGGTPGTDAGSTGAVAACSKETTGLTTCRQLELACENCPPGGAVGKNPTAVKCFALTDMAFVGKATDAACAKFAVDNKCKVDPGGNVCVTLNCDGTPGCEPGNNIDDRKTCAGAAHYGEKVDCDKFLPKCACK